VSQVFIQQTIDAASQAFRHLGRGAALNIYLSGDLGGGQVIVEAQTPGGSAWTRLAGGVLTTPGMHVIVAAPFVGRLRLEGADTAALDAWVEADNHQARWRVERAEA
jgi:hypothetical protein